MSSAGPFAGPRPPHRIGEHPRREQARHEQGDRAEEEELRGQAQSRAHGQRANARPGERADAPASVQARHERPPARSFHRDRLSIHGDVERPLERAPDEKRGEQGGQTAGQPDQGPGCAVAHQGRLHDAAAADPRDQVGRQQHRRDRPDRCPEERDAQRSVREPQVPHDVRDMRRPGCEQQPVHDKHGGDRDARPPARGRAGGALKHLGGTRHAARPPRRPQASRAVPRGRTSR